uniref:Pre-mRNA-splicing factor 18 n=1 Tax=Aceria tosichella TaxID=561515 RepID=A0A6G1SF55_9ACAR
MLPRKEVIKRLRERGQPIKLFGESDEDSYNRLRQLELSEPDATNGMGNDFKAAMDKVNDEINKTCERSSDPSSGNKNDVITTVLNTSIEEIRALIQELNPASHYTDERTVANDCRIIMKFFRFLLESWGMELNARPIEEKTSQEGKTVSARYTNTRANLKPLFKLLKKNTISRDILRQLNLISKDLVARDYKEANSHYIEMSVGNAAWPMGVTMVGIHARTGREKISQNNIAHALNDETQRKYIQGIKRLMTQCEKMFPTDPSRSSFR